MEKNYTTDAINLRTYNLSDSDKIMVMYSKDRGIIRSVAKGTKKPKSKLGARMDLLVANNLMFSKGRNMDTVCQAQTINSFKEIRKDIFKLMISSYISEIVANFGLENDPASKETYSLLYKTLEKISESGTNENENSKRNILLYAIKFQLKMMLIAGIIPELETCLYCGRHVGEDDMYFSKEQSGIVCKECNEKHHIPLKIQYKLRDFLVSMLQGDIDNKNEYEEKATEKICVVCFNLLREYIASHSVKKFNSDKVLAEVL